MSKKLAAFVVEGVLIMGVSCMGVVLNIIRSDKVSSKTKKLVYSKFSLAGDFGTASQKEVI